MEYKYFANFHPENDKNKKKSKTDTQHKDERENQNKKESKHEDQKMYNDICQRVHIQEFQAGSFVYQYGELGNNLSVILEGAVEQKKPSLVVLEQDTATPEGLISFIVMYFDDIHWSEMSMGQHILELFYNELSRLSVSVDKSGNFDKELALNVIDAAIYHQKSSIHMKIYKVVNPQNEATIELHWFKTKKEFGVNDHFGERALQKKPHTDTIRCTEKTILASISQYDYNEVKIRQKNREKRAKVNEISAYPFSIFANIGQNNLVKIFDLMEKEKVQIYERGATIYAEGDTNIDYVYFIKQGEFEVRKTIDAEFTDGQTSNNQTDQNPVVKQQNAGNLKVQKLLHSRYNQLSKMEVHGTKSESTLKFMALNKAKSIQVTILEKFQVFGMSEVVEKADQRSFTVTCQSTIGKVYRLKASTFLTQVHKYEFHEQVIGEMIMKYKQFEQRVKQTHVFQAKFLQKMHAKKVTMMREWAVQAQSWKNAQRSTVKESKAGKEDQFDNNSDQQEDISKSKLELSSFLDCSELYKDEYSPLRPRKGESLQIQTFKKGMLETFVKPKGWQIERDRILQKQYLFQQRQKEFEQHCAEGFHRQVKHEDEVEQFDIVQGERKISNKQMIGNISLQSESQDIIYQASKSSSPSVQQRNRNFGGSQSLLKSSSESFKNIIGLNRGGASTEQRLNKQINKKVMEAKSIVDEKLNMMQQKKERIALQKQYNALRKDNFRYSMVTPKITQSSALLRKESMDIINEGLKSLQTLQKKNTAQSQFLKSERSNNSMPSQRREMELINDSFANRQLNNDMSMLRKHTSSLTKSSQQYSPPKLRKSGSMYTKSFTSSFLNPQSTHKRLFENIKTPLGQTDETQRAAFKNNLNSHGIQPILEEVSEAVIKSGLISQPVKINQSSSKSLQVSQENECKNNQNQIGTESVSYGFNMSIEDQMLDYSKKQTPTLKAVEPLPLISTAVQSLVEVQEGPQQKDNPTAAIGTEGLKLKRFQQQQSQSRLDRIPESLIRERENTKYSYEIFKGDNSFDNSMRRMLDEIDKQESNIDRVLRDGQPVSKKPSAYLMRLASESILHEATFKREVITKDYSTPKVRFINKANNPSEKHPHIIFAQNNATKIGKSTPSTFFKQSFALKKNQKTIIAPVIKTTTTKSGEKQQTVLKKSKKSVERTKLFKLNGSTSLNSQSMMPTLYRENQSPDTNFDKLIRSQPKQRFQKDELESDKASFKVPASQKTISQNMDRVQEEKLQLRQQQTSVTPSKSAHFVSYDEHSQLEAKGFKSDLKHTQIVNLISADKKKQQQFSGKESQQQKQSIFLSQLKQPKQSRLLLEKEKETLELGNGEEEDSVIQCNLPGDLMIDSEESTLKTLKTDQSCLIPYEVRQGNTDRSRLKKVSKESAISMLQDNNQKGFFQMSLPTLNYKHLERSNNNNLNDDSSPTKSQRINHQRVQSGLLSKEKKKQLQVMQSYRELPRQQYQMKQQQSKSKRKIVKDKEDDQYALVLPECLKKPLVQQRQYRQQVGQIGTLSQAASQSRLSSMQATSNIQVMPLQISQKDILDQPQKGSSHFRLSQPQSPVFKTEIIRNSAGKTKSIVITKRRNPLL